MVEWLTRTSTSPSMRSLSASSCQSTLWPEAPLEATRALNRCMPDLTGCETKRFVSAYAIGWMVSRKGQRTPASRPTCAGNRACAACAQLATAAPAVRRTTANESCTDTWTTRCKYYGRIPKEPRLTWLIIDEYLSLSRHRFLYKIDPAVVNVHHALRPAGNAKIKRRNIATQHRIVLVKGRTAP